MTAAPQANGERGEQDGARSASVRARRRSVITGVAIAAVVAAACGAIAGRRMMDRTPQYAQVIAVTPISRRVRVPREVCKSEEVRHERPEPDPRGSTGKQTEHDAGADDTYTTTEEHCATVYEIDAQPQGYEVRYRLNGVEGAVHMDHAPGPRIPLRDGRLVPEDSPAGAGAAGPT